MTRSLAVLVAGALALPAALSAQTGTGVPPSDATSSYAAVDALADSAPPAVERSVAALAAYLAQAGPDDSSRARAIYRWLTGHVTYDVGAFRSGQPGSLSPEEVLRRRTSVCQGYAGLAEALGAAMGLELEVVNGWSKGYGYTPGQQFDGPTNHAWIAVKIAGRWRLMDPTWGAGYLDASLRFVRQFQEHYFLTRPEEFVFDHLPLDPRWQLLDPPLTAKAYADLVYLRPMFFRAGLQIGAPRRLVITADSDVTVTLGLTRPVEMTAEVLEAEGQRPLDGAYALAQVGGEAARIDARFPRRGDYLLRVFAKTLGAPGDLGWVLDYRVRAARGARAAEFPAVYEAFSARRVELLAPLNGVLRVGARHLFRLRAPGALEVAVVAGGRWTRLTRRGEEFTGEADATPGPVVVFAKYDRGAGYEGLLRYTGR